MTPKGPRAGELLKKQQQQQQQQKKKRPSLAPVPPELLGKVAQQVSPSVGPREPGLPPPHSLQLQLNKA